MSKCKGHFNIGLYAKRRKQIIEEIVNKKVVVDIKVKRLQNKLSYTKRKVHYCSLEFYFKIIYGQVEGNLRSEIDFRMLILESSCNQVKNIKPFRL